MVEQPLPFPRVNSYDKMTRAEILGLVVTPVE